MSNIKSYGIEGDSQETRTELELGAPYVLMPSTRPSKNHVCRGGLWVEEKPTEYKHMTSREFMRLLAPERALIMKTKADDVNMAMFYDDLIAASYVTISDADTQAGLGYMLKKGLLTPARYEEVVSAMKAEMEG